MRTSEVISLTRTAPDGRPDHRPTLLVFTLGADQDALRHPLLPARLRAAERDLREACLETALEAGRRAGCRIVISSPRRLATGPDVGWIPQPGGTFGDRLRGVLDRALVENPGPVLVVGADSPGLEAGHLRRTLEILEADPDAVVLGPAVDGGVYLLGACRPFDAALAAARWCERGTRASLLQSLAREGRPAVVLDTPLLDLDTRADLERWIAAGASAAPALRAPVARLSRLLAGVRRPPASSAPRPAVSPWARLHSGRAPPPPTAR